MCPSVVSLHASPSFGAGCRGRLVGFLPVSECKYRALFPFLQTFLHFLMFDFSPRLSYFGHRPRNSLSIRSLHSSKILSFSALFRPVVGSSGRRVVGSSGRRVVGSSGRRVVGSSSYIRGCAYLLTRDRRQEDGTGGRHRRTAQEDAKRGALWRLSPRRWGYDTNGTEKRPKIVDFGAFRAFRRAC